MHNISLYYSDKDENTFKYIQSLLKLNFEDNQVIIIDNKRTWQPDQIPIRSRIVVPNSMEEVVNFIIQLKSYINPRLKLILVDNLPYFFRDFHDKKSQVDKNIKLMAFIINTLKNYSEMGIEIILTGYNNPIRPSNPLMGHIMKFYGIKIYLLKIDNEKLHIIHQ